MAGISSSIRNRLIAIQREIVFNGKSVNAAEAVPQHLHDPYLPMFVTMRSPATTSQRTQYEKTLLTSSWQMTLYLRHVQDNYEAQTEEDIDDLIDLTYAEFLSRPRLELAGSALSRIENAEIVSAQSNKQNYPVTARDGLAYHAITFVIQVTYQMIRCESSWSS